MRTLPFTKKKRKDSPTVRADDTVQTAETKTSALKAQKTLPDFEGMNLIDLLLTEEPRVEGFSIPGRDNSPDTDDNPQS